MMGGDCSEDSWDGWSYLCQCEGNICQSETMGSDYAAMLASRHRLLLITLLLAALALAAFLTGLAALLWRQRKAAYSSPPPSPPTGCDAGAWASRSVRFRTGADIRAEEAKAGSSSGTPVRNGAVGNGGPAPSAANGKGKPIVRILSHTLIHPAPSRSHLREIYSMQPCSDYLDLNRFPLNRFPRSVPTPTESPAAEHGGGGDNGPPGLLPPGPLQPPRRLGR